VVVVGAGPAGASAALAARRARPGARVLLLDKAAFPRDKACGDGIAAHALDELAALGVTGAAAGSAPVARLCLRTPGGAVAVRTMARPAHVIPRRVFDARLVDAARAAGAELRTARVRALEQRDGQVVLTVAPGRAPAGAGAAGEGGDRGGGHRATGCQVAAPVVVAADGANSTVRRLLGVAPQPPAHLAIAVRGYATAPPGPPEQLIALVAQGWPAYYWSFPIGDGTANVGYGLLRGRLTGGREDLHARLAALLPGQPADPATLRAHHLPLSTVRPRPVHGRVLLSGDAASLVNPLTGEGIYYAVATGARAGAAAVGEDPAGAYVGALRRLLVAHLRQTGVLGRALRHRPLVDAAVRAAARSRPVFDDLVEVRLGAGRVGPVSLARVAAAYRPWTR